MTSLHRENPERAELERLTQEYLARGGKITVIGTTAGRAPRSLREAADASKRAAQREGSV